jgi:DNA-binding SARP family transcriptional activator
MDFRILGPLEMSHDADVLSVGGPRQQTVLAMLLLAANRVMPVDRLATALWEDAPPPTARSQVQMCISGLRRQLAGAADGRQRIAGSRAGYVLSTNGDRLDAEEFGSQAAAARQALAARDLLSARQVFRSALELWRGPALAGVESRLVQQGAAMLHERRLIVAEECLACELGLGLYRDAMAELAVLVKEYPLRERFHALLMLALYGADRQAEALAAYRCARETLVEELGIEPGTALQQVHEAILAGTPVRGLLALVGQPMAATLADGSLRSDAATEHVPRLLIADIPDFTGRSGIVQQFAADIMAGATDAAADHAPVPINVITGRGGVGKTTLAVHIAHKVAAHFPDGQLFARLRIDDRPADPADILERFLHALGLNGSALPDDVEKRAELYRDKLAERRVLIVLDDVTSEQQISMLLPGSALCPVIITSRRRLTGLAATRRLELGNFSHGSAAKLVASIAGPERIEAEPTAVTALCTLCGYLPLALRIVGARLAARPHWTVADLVDRLADESRRLDELNHGDMGVRASIALSYDSLSAGARALFRRLALFNAPSFGYWVGAPLLDTSVEAGRDFMDELTDAYLMEAEARPGGAVRYRFHDIMRLFARERLAMDESPLDRHGALERLLGSILQLAVEAHHREYSGDFLLPHGGGSRWPLPDWLIDRMLKDPPEWYEHERPSIVAAVGQAAGSGMTGFAWELALSSVALLESHSRFTDRPGAARSAGSPAHGPSCHGDSPGYCTEPACDAT